MAEAGAKAALEGFRKQGLYTLWRSFTAAGIGDDLEFLVEGTEDLDVYNAGQLLERLQVKAYGADLSLSALGPKKPASFLRRVVSLPNDGSETRVVSCSPIGPELRGAWLGEAPHRANVTAKLRAAGYSDEEVQRVYERVTFEEVHADTLQAEVFGRLRESLMGGDPTTAFDLLLGWMLAAAERGERITGAVLRAKITAVGRYLAERAAHHAEWFTSIVPLEDNSVDEVRAAELSNSYYRGVAAEYEHILAGVDVVRAEPLDAIDAAFAAGSRVVIVHGASGQGKSTVAYRYLHDYVPAEWRFMVRAIEDRQHALSVAAALAGHLRAVGASMYVYVDVSHRDMAWPDLIRALLAEPAVKILVTIREEDLARQALPDSDLGFPSLVQLQFDRSDARAVYDQLALRHPPNAFPRFQDAWQRFGESGPLMEFAFLVTQNETLAERLSAQVRRLQLEVLRGELPAPVLDLLHAVAIANAGEARIDLRGVAADVGLQAPGAVVALLEREYLVRTTENGRYAVALHPIRSVLLARLLTDAAFSPWQDAAVRALSYVPETDLEGFLLHGLLRGGDEAEAVVTALRHRRLVSWAGLAGVCRVMLWWALWRRVQSDRAITDEARRTFGSGWWVALQSDLFGLLAEPDGVLKLMDDFNPERAALARDLRARQAPLHTVLQPVGEWLHTQRVEPSAPNDSTDWDGLAEVHYWSVRAAPDSGVAQWARQYDLAPAVNALPLGVLAEVVYSLSTGPEAQFRAQIEPHRDAIRARFRRETATVFVEEAGALVRAHFLVPPDNAGEGPSTRFTDATPSKDRLHDLASDRIVLLRLLEPERERYGSQGYGHRIGLVDLPYDPTENAAGALAQYLHPRWPTGANATYTNLMNLPYRPATWLNYATEVIESRRRALENLSRLRRALNEHFVSKEPVRIVGGVIQIDEWNATASRLGERPLLPRAAVDDWGFVGDSRSRTGAASLTSEDANFISRVRLLGAGLAVERYTEYLQRFRDYAGSLQNFFQQSVPVLLLHSFEGHLRIATVDEQLAEYRASSKCDAQKVFLSVYNLHEARQRLRPFQVAFRDAFAGLLDGRELRELERRELEVLDNVWPLYYQFANEPAGRVKERPEFRARLRMQSVADELLRRVKSAVQALRAERIPAVVRDERVEWEGAPALWIRLDVTDASRWDEMLERVLTAVQSVFGAIQLRSRDAFVVEDHWPYVVVLPMVGGKSRGAAIRILTSSFFEGQDILTGAWRFFPVQIPVETLAQLRLNVESDAEGNSADLLLGALVELRLRFGSWADISRIPGERDEIALALMSEYVERHMESVRAAWQRALDALDEVRASPGDVARQEQQQANVFFELIDDCLTRRLTSDDGGQIGLEECAAVADDLSMAITALNEARRLLNL